MTAGLGLLVRLAVGNDQSARTEWLGLTGKRRAGKLACAVWNGGKAVKPYLSLPFCPRGIMLEERCSTFKLTASAALSARRGHFI